MANTLNLGNGDWATKEDSLLGYNSENGNYKPLPFDFTRASNGTFINKSGLIETAANGVPRIDFLGNTSGALLLEPQRTNLVTQSELFSDASWSKSNTSVQGDPSTAGSELVTNGDFATDTDWVKQAGWTISGGTANCDGSQNLPESVYQNGVTVVGKTYKITYTLVSITSGTVRAVAGTLGGAFQSTIGTHTEYLTATSNTVIQIQASSSFIGSIDNVSVKEVQGFASPDGTTNAYKLVEGTNNGVHYVGSSNIGVTLGNDTTFSVFVKKGESNFIQLLFSGASHSGSNYANFDLLNGVLGSVGGGVAKIEFIGGFYRCSFTSQATATTATNAYIWKIQSATSPRAESYTGDGTSGVYIYGAQLEQGSYSTSLINTQGSAVTRVADVCSQTPPSGVIGQTEGTIFFNADVTNTFGVQLGNSSGGGDFINSIQMAFGSASTNALVFNGGAVQFSYSGAANTGIKKFALAYKQNDFAIYIDGNQIITDNLGTIPSISGIFFNHQNLGTNGGKLNDFRLYNTRLSNAELQALTS